MQVRDWMTAQVERVNPREDVLPVWARMRARRVRQFPVVEGGRVVGMITDRDLRGAKEGATVASLMTRDPLTTTPQTPIEDAAAALLTARIGALPVLNAGTLVGIISESDLLRALVELTRILEPTTLLEVQCADGMRDVQRAEHALARAGASVLWRQTSPEPGGALRLRIRLRSPVGHAPEQTLAEAGLPVVLCVLGGGAGAARGSSS